MSAHTPGPWDVSPPTAQNPSEARVVALSGFVRIYSAPLTQETEANARLISAAPDLQEALGAALADLGDAEDEDLGPRTWMWKQKAVAALKKARGE